VSVASQIEHIAYSTFSPVGLLMGRRLDFLRFSYDGLAGGGGTFFFIIIFFFFLIWASFRLAVFYEGGL